MAEKQRGTKEPFVESENSGLKQHSKSMIMASGPIIS